MPEYSEIWQTWYEAQVMEQSNHKLKYPQDKPTLHAAEPFDPDKDVLVLRKAVKGLGTSEEDIIRILTKRSTDQRNQIRDKYQLIHGKDLIKDLKDDLGGNFKRAIISLMRPLPLFLAEQIKHASKGVGTDEAALIEILCSRDDDSIKAIKEAFENQYEEPIEIAICGETSGMFRKLLITILSLRRNDSGSSPAAAADILIAGEADENVIKKTFTSYTFPFLKEVFDIYQTKTGKDFQEVIQKKFSGDTKRAFKAIFLASKCKSEFYALALHDAMKGFGTDNWELIRIIVSRCEIDLGTIKEKYTEIFGKDLVEQIKSETSSDYQKTLVSLLGSE